MRYGLKILCSPLGNCYQLLLVWLHALPTLNIHHKVVGFRHAWQLWEKIHYHFQSKTEAKAHQLCIELRVTKKGDSSIAEIFMHIKAIANALISVAESVSIQKQLDAILKRLPSECESLVTLINSKSDWFDFDEIESLLFGA